MESEELWTNIFPEVDIFSTKTNITTGVLLCPAFIEGHPTFAGCKIHWPIGDYIASDELALQKILPMVPNPGTYREILKLWLPNTNCLEGSGIQSYLSLAIKNKVKETTIYLNPKTKTFITGQTGNIKL